MRRQQRVIFIRQRGGGFRPFAGFGDMIPIGTNVANDPDVIAATAAVNRAGTMPEMFPVNSANWNVLVNQQNLLAALLRGELTLDRFRKELNDRTLYLRAINPSNYVLPPVIPPVVLPPVVPPVVLPPVIQPPIGDSHPAPPAGYHYDNNWQLVPDVLDPDPYQSPPIIAGPLPSITTTGVGMLDGTVTLPVIGTVSKTTALLIAVAALLLIKN